MIDYKDIDFDKEEISNKEALGIRNLLRDCRNELCYKCREANVRIGGREPNCKNCRWRDEQLNR